MRTMATLIECYWLAPFTREYENQRFVEEKKEFYFICINWQNGMKLNTLNEQPHE